MIRYILLFLFVASACTSTFTKTETNVLVVAGGHSFDTLAFYAIFDRMDAVVFESAMQPEANQMIASGKADGFDAIVFYDSWQGVSDAEKQAYLQLLENGTGMVFLHHALVSYQNWHGFTEIIGGKYRHPNYTDDPELVSDFKHDIWLHVTANPDHPITVGIKAFDIFDEGYMNLDVLPSVTPLLYTNHEHCHDLIGWAHEVHNSRVVYLLPGHAEPGLSNPNYIQIIENAIRWVSE